MSNNATNARLSVLESRIESLLIRMDRLYNSVHKVTLPKKVRPVNVTKSVNDIVGTNYIVLSDGSVARRLKPTKKGSHKYYNLMLRGRLTAYKADLFKEVAKKSNQHSL
jgi:hypothetical protein